MREVINEVIKMNSETRAFLFSIVFQVCGALILLLGSFRNTKSQVVEAYFDADRFGKINDDSIIEISLKTVSVILRGIYYNRLSFAFLVAGYSITIWANIGDYPRNKMFEFVLCLTVTFLIVSCIFIVTLSYFFGIFKRKIKYRDLERGTMVNIKTGTSKNNAGEEIVHIKTIIKE